MASNESLAPSGRSVAGVIFMTKGAVISVFNCLQGAGAGVTL